MSDSYNQSTEVIAKEITIALIQKYSFAEEELIYKVKNIYNEIHKQVIESYNKNYK